jgi:hypothetical protein
MQIIELYTGQDGYAHTRDYRPEEFARLVRSHASGPISVGIPNSPRARPAGFLADWHPFTGASCGVMCTGISEYETADGVRRLYPGDVVIFNDENSHGHKYRVVGLEGRVHVSVRWSVAESS